MKSQAIKDALMIDFEQHGEDLRTWTAYIDDYLIKISASENAFEINLDDMLNYYGPIIYKGYKTPESAMRAAPLFVRKAVKNRAKEMKRQK